MTSLSETAQAARRGRIHWLAAWSGVTVVGGAALMTLAYYQHEFGVNYAKMPSLLAWTFSVGLDWGGFIASIFWFLGDGKMARWGRGSAIALLIGSSSLTAISFGTIAGWPYAALGAIPSAVAFVMAKLLMLWQADRAERLGHADALDTYRGELARARDRVAGYHRILDEATVHALAAVWFERATLARERAALDADRAELAAALTALEIERAKQQGAAAAPKRQRPAGARRAPAPLRSTDQMHREAVEYLRANRKKDGTPAGRYNLARHLGLDPNQHQAKTIHDAARAVVDAERSRTGTD